MISHEKEDFIGEKGLIINFYNNKVRTIVRNTNDYGVLLNASTHPKYLLNAAERNKLFDYMWGSLNIEEKFEHIISAEINDLLNGDIPYFSSIIGEASLYDSYDNEYKDFFKQSLLQKVIYNKKNLK